jgi:predicted metal-dependent hydrolase
MAQSLLPGDELPPEGKLEILAGYPVYVQRKKVKRAKLIVLPPEGALQFTAPPTDSLEYLERFVADHAAWIEKHAGSLRKNIGRPRHHYGSGEIIRRLDAPLTLQVVHGAGYHAQQDGSRLILTVPENASEEARRRVVEDWQRTELENVLAPMAEHWESVIGHKAGAWRILPMKSLWGSCNRATQVVTINQRLAALPADYLEYVVVHELCHFIEPNHSKAFWQCVHSCLPDWKQRRDGLDQYWEDWFGDLRE